MTTFSRALQSTVAAGAALFVGGCTVGEPMVDPYKGLLPANYTISDAPQKISAKSLKKSKVYLVTGANFENYIAVWKKTNDTWQQQAGFFKATDGVVGELAKQSAAVVVGGMDNPVEAAVAGKVAEAATSQSGPSFNDTMDKGIANWAPNKKIDGVSKMLKRHFAEVGAASDLADARAKGAEWIVIFDHAFEQPTTATATWTNTTQIDLLDKNLARVVTAKTSEKKEHGAAHNDQRWREILQLRGDDVTACIERTSADFEVKLKAAQS